MLKDKNIILGITGGIAAYKSCVLVSLLKKSGANVDIIMTKNATEFVTPLTLETLSQRPVISNMFQRETPWEVEHISLAKKADLFVVAPASANFIGKYANGIADDMLTTTIMATKAKVLLAPAMNTGMYTSDAFIANINILKKRNVNIIDCNNGKLACGDVGKGRMAEPEVIFAQIEDLLNQKQDFEGKNILVTAGATIEKLDGVRYLTNYSSGKMGIAIAQAAQNRGAFVTLILGRHTANLNGNENIITVETTDEMFNAVIDRVKNNDIIIKAAAPCDYKPTTFTQTKIKSQQLHLDFIKNVDIAAEVGKIKENRKLVIFSAETENLIENAHNKLVKKNADMVVANDVTEKGAGFNVDTNKVTIISSKGICATTELLPKSDIANIILDNILLL
ncbi:MAG: bifunctional phosphopantothenoylcysteine decarboxylase/phosphopantothenate--cysteine ligase CoaBC [Clostridia bacterium]